MRWSTSTPAASRGAPPRSRPAAAERSVAELPDDAWDRLARSPGGQPHTMRRVLEGRIREVELHHVDLGLGYEPADWPADFARAELPRALEHMGRHLDPRAFLG